MKHKKGLSFQWGKAHLQVDFYIPVARRLRLLTGLELTIATGFLIAVLVRHRQLGAVLSGGLLLVVFVLFIAVVIRAAHRFTFHEKVFIDASHITLVQTTCLSRSVRSYDRRGMGPLRHTLTENTGIAPMCSPVDLFCEGYNQQLRKAVHDAGNLYFDYAGERIFFGRGVYSWHAEDLALYLQLYCGSSLQFGPEWQPMLEAVEEQDF